MPTLRAIILLFLAAPIFALSAALPVFRWVALAYFIGVCMAFFADWRRAGKVDRFEISRTNDDKLSLGADNTVALNVRNRLPQSTTIWLRDEPPDQWVDGATLLQSELAAHEQWRGTYTVHPLRRGDYAFGDVTIRWLGPWGLVVRQATVKESAAPVKVYPNLLDVRRYDLMLRRNQLQQIGLRNTRQFGEGTEYERLRDYLPDDDFRRINWKATARRNKPITVEYQTERSQNIMAVLDIGRMMQSPVENIAKLDYVVNATLLLGYVAAGMGDKVGLMTFADDVQQYLSPKQGRAQFYRMLETLYAIEAQPVEPDYGRSLAYLSHKQRKRTLIVIFTDLLSGVSMDALVASCAQLAKRSLPLVVTITDPDVYATSQETPTNSLGVFEQTAATQMLNERRLALENLRRRGVLTLDVPAHQLSLSVIQRYLDIKRKSQF